MTVESTGRLFIFNFRAMLKLVLKSIVYVFFVLIVLELLVRAFHLHNDRPERFVDKDSLNKWVPGQEGYSVFGNRRQVLARYRINSSGYNSYREYLPTEEDIEIALIGDSFIEGFHQDVDNSIGHKIEDFLGDSVKVFEFGHSAYDLADQLHTIQSNPETFRLVDYVILAVWYEDDLTREAYEPINRMPSYAFLNYSKLLVYAQDIGLFDPLKRLSKTAAEFRKGESTDLQGLKETIDLDKRNLANFKKLSNHYEFDKKRWAFLLDGSITNQEFLDYLDSQNIQVIDYSKAFYNDDVPKTLIFDQHWNDKGRALIARLIADFVQEKERKMNKM